jgi:hypothetical protein
MKKRTLLPTLTVNRETLLPLDRHRIGGAQGITQTTCGSIECVSETGSCNCTGTICSAFC